MCFERIRFRTGLEGLEEEKKMKGKKAQITPVAIIMTFIAIVIYAALLPTINSLVTTACTGVDATTCFVLQMIPWMIGIGIIGSIFVYTQVRFGQ